MALDAMTTASKFMKRRKFDTAIKILESRAEIYEDNFEYYLMLGIAYLYAGLIGVASSYFQKARRIKLTDSRLLLCQAVIFLRRGETEKALQYYTEVLDGNPKNKLALKSIEFIRIHGDYETICKWVDSGKIEKFYPSLGVNPGKIAGIIISALLLVSVFCFSYNYFNSKSKIYKSERADLSSLELSGEEKNNLQEKDISSKNYGYILSSKEIQSSYENAVKYFQTHRDNLAQVEINRILNSNASDSVKQKLLTLKGFLEEPSFDSISDVPFVKQVESEPVLYQDCWVSWNGRISDSRIYDDGSYSCKLLVGYEKLENVDGIVDVRFEKNPEIAGDQPVRILAKISLENGKIILKGKSVFQSVKGVLQ